MFLVIRLNTQRVLRVVQRHTNRRHCDVDYNRLEIFYVLMSQTLQVNKLSIKLIKHPVNKIIYWLGFPPLQYLYERNLPLYWKGRKKNLARIESAEILTTRQGSQLTTSDRLFKQ